MRILETNDYYNLAKNLRLNGLEIDEEEGIPEGLVKCWKLVDEEDNLKGGLVLAKREGEFIIDGIAVDAQLRKGDYGSKLLALAEEEVKKLTGEQIYLVARAPGFFRKHDFNEIKREEAPEFFECFTCPQYNVTCFPEVMKKVL